MNKKNTWTENRYLRILIKTLCSEAFLVSLFTAVKLISCLFKAADVVLLTATMKNMANSYLTAIETHNTDKLKCLRTIFNLRHEIFIFKRR